MFSKRNRVIGNGGRGGLVYCGAYLDECENNACSTFRENDTDRLNAGDDATVSVTFCSFTNEIANTCQRRRHKCMVIIKKNAFFFFKSLKSLYPPACTRVQQRVRYHFDGGFFFMTSKNPAHTSVGIKHDLNLLGPRFPTFLTTPQRSKVFAKIPETPPIVVRCVFIFYDFGFFSQL